MPLSAPITPDLTLIRQWLPQRTVQSYKYQIGYLLAIVGSQAFPGAATLSCQAAARVGAGAVKVIIPQSIWAVLANHFKEIILVSTSETNEGTLSSKAFPILLSHAEKCRAGLIGCGLGRHTETRSLFQHVLTTLKLPLLLDADALWMLASFGEEFIREHSQGNWILTPHDGEFARLVNQNHLRSEERQSLLQQKAQEWKCTILLKGFPGLIACPDGTVYINPTGNPAATTAGCGDVLAGICSGFLAQGLSPPHAAVTGLYVAGLAADHYIKNYGGHTLLASDLIDQIPFVLGGIYERIIH